MSPEVILQRELLRYFNYRQTVLQLLRDIYQLQLYETLMQQQTNYFQRKIQRRQHKTHKKIEDYQSLDLLENNNQLHLKYHGKIGKLQLKFGNLQRLQMTLQQESIMIRRQVEDVRLRIQQQNINEKNCLTPLNIQ